MQELPRIGCEEFGPARAFSHAAIIRDSRVYLITDNGEAIGIQEGGNRYPRKLKKKMKKLGLPTKPEKEFLGLKLEMLNGE